MVDRARGFRGKSRHKLSKRTRDRGNLTITKILQEFNIGDKVRIIQEPAVQGGMPHPKYKNNTGKILEKRGKSYLVQISDQGKPKQIISRAAHLVKL